DQHRGGWPLHQQRGDLDPLSPELLGQALQCPVLPTKLRGDAGALARRAGLPRHEVRVRGGDVHQIQAPAAAELGRQLDRPATERVEGPSDDNRSTHHSPLTQAAYVGAATTSSARVNGIRSPARRWDHSGSSNPWRPAWSSKWTPTASVSRSSRSQYCSRG